MKLLLTLTVLAVLVAVATCQPQRKSDAEYMDIYRKCRQRFGTKPSVACRWVRHFVLPLAPPQVIQRLPCARIQVP
jgi:hypothetical protein